MQRNNNENVVDSQLDITREEGKCSQNSNTEPGESVQKGDGCYNPEQQISDSIDKRIDDSISKVKSYFEQKFENLSRVAQLEKELAENRKQLELLKLKGKVLNPSDFGGETQSKITIYHNAVQKQRGSTSSEDDLIDTSDEMLDPVVALECELHKRARIYDRSGIRNLAQ